MKILAISGSLRTASINTAFCRVVSELAPASVSVEVFSGIGRLPLFNPDLEPAPPASVQEFRHAVGQADALLIASPEYAHGVSGVLKNALDWLVAYEGAVDKPVALVNTSPRAHHAYDALREVLNTMSMTVLDDASFSIPLLGAHNTQEAMLSAPQVRNVVEALIEAIANGVAGDSQSRPVFPVA